MCILEEDKELHINWRRVATTSLFGMAFVGPVGHFCSFQQVALDGIISGPVDLFVFFTYMGFASGKTFNQAKDDVKRNFLPTLVLEGGIWLMVQVANFRFIPIKYQLLYVNSFCLLDNCFLSRLEKQQDAAWKQWFKILSSNEHKNKED
ncbi:hypothetical protein Hanom_Chr02g00130941 [Helianthus anomalus]